MSINNASIYENKKRIKHWKMAIIYSSILIEAIFLFRYHCLSDVNGSNTILVEQTAK